MPTPAACGASYLVVTTARFPRVTSIRPAAFRVARRDELCWSPRRSAGLSPPRWAAGRRPGSRQRPAGMPGLSAAAASLTTSAKLGVERLQSLSRAGSPTLRPTQAAHACSACPPRCCGSSSPAPQLKPPVEQLVHRRLYEGCAAHQPGSTVESAPARRPGPQTDRESSRVPCRSFLSRKDEVCRRRSIPS
jgi:hypothetical protein